MTKKSNPRSEVAMREAIRRRNALTWRFNNIPRDGGTMEVYAFQDHITGPDCPPIAIFDLRACYRLRKPTKGISKKVLALLKGKK